MKGVSYICVLCLVFFKEQNILKFLYSFQVIFLKIAYLSGWIETVTGLWRSLVVAILASHLKYFELMKWQLGHMHYMSYYSVCFLKSIQINL